jgi:hypothetical protein
MEFKRKYNLERHVSTVHNDEARFACGECSRQYKRKRDLDRHVNDEHLKVRPFVCGECQLAFAGSEQLRKHRKEKHGSASRPTAVESASVAASAPDSPNVCDVPSLALLKAAGEVLRSESDGDFQLADELTAALTADLRDNEQQQQEQEKQRKRNEHEHVHCDDCGHLAVVHDGHVDWIVNGRLETADHEDHGIAPDERTLNEWLSQLFEIDSESQQRVLLQ